MTKTQLKLLPTTIALALLVLPARAAEPPCDRAVEALKMEQVDLKDLIAAEERELTIVKSERDDARKLAADSEPLIPGWILFLGGCAAGAFVAEVVH